MPRKALQMAIYADRNVIQNFPFSASKATFSSVANETHARYGASSQAAALSKG